MTLPADYGQVARRLLERVRYQEPPAAELAELRSADTEKLYACLATDAKKKAFWLNLYNRPAARAMRENPHLFSDKKAFFGPELRPVFIYNPRDWAPETVEGAEAWR